MVVFIGCLAQIHQVRAAEEHRAFQQPKAAQVSPGPIRAGGSGGLGPGQLFSGGEDFQRSLRDPGTPRSPWGTGTRAPLSSSPWKKRLGGGKGKICGLKVGKNPLTRLSPQNNNKWKFSSFSVPQDSLVGLITPPMALLLMKELVGI